MIKKIMLILVLATQTRAMEINEAIGTLMLASSYYGGIEVYVQNYTVHPSNFPKDEIRIACTLGSLLTQISGNALLAPVLVKSANPALTMAKFHGGAFSLALGAYQLKMAKYYENNEQERDWFLGYAAICVVTGSGLLWSAMNDTKN